MPEQEEQRTFGPRARVRRILKTRCSRRPFTRRFEPIPQILLLRFEPCLKLDIQSLKYATRSGGKGAEVTAKAPKTRAKLPLSHKELCVFKSEWEREREAQVLCRRCVALIGIWDLLSDSVFAYVHCTMYEQRGRRRKTTFSKWGQCESRRKKRAAAGELCEDAPSFVGRRGGKVTASEALTATRDSPL